MNITRGVAVLSDATPERIHFGAAADAGTVTEGSRADHHHAQNSPTAPVTQAFGDAAATGAGEEGARRDHRHGMPAAPTRTIWVQPHAITGAVNLDQVLDTNWGAAILGTGSSSGQAFFSFPIPSDMATITKAVAVIIAQPTGNARIAFTSQFGADGEARTADTDSIAEATIAVIGDELLEVDIAALFTGIAAGDYVGVQLDRDGADALDTTTNVFVLGILIEYV